MKQNCRSFFFNSKNVSVLLECKQGWLSQFPASHIWKVFLTNPLCGSLKSPQTKHSFHSVEQLQHSQRSYQLDMTGVVAALRCCWVMRSLAPLPVCPMFLKSQTTGDIINDATFATNYRLSMFLVETGRFFFKNRQPIWNGSNCFERLSGNCIWGKSFSVCLKSLDRKGSHHYHHMYTFVMVYFSHFIRISSGSVERRKIASCLI